ncbi:MAG: glycoside hydrolase family 88 protein [Gammaproteobacteria bacterium]|nr:glycoside hydrolase family 88 protein [Gammaproteobacteria bacterium]
MRRNTMQRAALLWLLMLVAGSAVAQEIRDIGLTDDGEVIQAWHWPAPPVTDTRQIVIVTGDDPAAVIRTVNQLSIAQGVAVSLLELHGLHDDVFPPSGSAYREHSSANAIWRWLVYEAPDVVISVGNDHGLGQALAQHGLDGLGAVTTVHVAASDQLARLLARKPSASEAASAMRARLARSPEQVARQLAESYGRNFNGPTYIPGMALLARLRLQQTEYVAELAGQYVKQKDPMARPSSLAIAAHTVFAALAEITGDQEMLALARRAADLAFDEHGQPLPAMPYHGEMSDAVFMNGPLLSHVGQLTGEQRYFAMTVRHIQFMQDLVLRNDGLYRHGPGLHAAWGRGNAFPALGLAMSLEHIPPDNPAFQTLAASLKAQLAVLLQWQTPDGMWREIIDMPGAWRELSATAMIAAAMLKAVELGVVEGDAYHDAVERAWQAVLRRTGADGNLLDVCESTPRQPDDAAYLNRAAVFGRDDRGGAMVMYFATELMARDSR